MSLRKKKSPKILPNPFSAQINAQLLPWKKVVAQTFGLLLKFKEIYPE
jgi:hypothetical protein